MDPETQNILKQAWLSAPQKSKDVVLARAYSRVVQNAVSGFGLDTEGVASLQLEVLFVLLGIQTIVEFEDEITNHSALSTEQGQKFVRRMRDELFTGLAPHLSGYVPEEKTQSNTLATVAAAVETYGLVRERLERLPMGVQTTIRSPQMEHSLGTLITKYQLNPDNATVFTAEAVRVMVGLTTTNNFKTEVTRATGLDPNTLDALFLDTESALFKPVRLAIMQALEGRNASAPTVSPTLPTTPVVPSTDPYREPV